MTTKKRPLPASLTFSHLAPLKKDAPDLSLRTDSDLDNDDNDSFDVLRSTTTTASRPYDDDDDDDDHVVDEDHAAAVAAAAADVRLANLGSPSGRKLGNADFKRLMTLGTGSFAKVILVQSQLRGDEGTLYAMKVLDAQQILRKKQAAHTMTERSVLGQTSSHPFIVSLRYAYRTPHTLNLVMDFCNGGELYFHLTRVKRFSEARAKFYAAELTLALEHLHAHDVVYRDLKPENVLIAGDGHIMLADFGLSKEGIRDCSRGTDTFCGTPEYLAPEVLFRTGHGTAVDWWSLGIVLYEMIVGLPPWYTKNRHHMFNHICYSELVFPPEQALYVSPEARDMIGSLLVKNPRDRLGSGPVEAVKAHSFFTELDMDAVLRKELPVPWMPEPGKIYFDVEYTQMPCESPKHRFYAAAARSKSEAAEGAPTSSASAASGHDNTSTTQTRQTQQQQQHQQPGQQQQQALAPSFQQPRKAGVSPIFPSSIVEKAFSGFSYTDPASAAALQQHSLEQRHQRQHSSQHQQMSSSPGSLNSWHSSSRPLAQRLREAFGTSEAPSSSQQQQQQHVRRESGLLPPSAEAAAAADMAAEGDDGLGHFSLELEGGGDSGLDEEEGVL